MADEEELPPYSCTVYKQGYVKLKTEIMNGERGDRKWKVVYFKLVGTLLEMYNTKTEEKPFNSVSMNDVYCGVPSDYQKKTNVLRLTLLLEFQQYLFEPVGGIVQVISWFEHLHASATISSDIDRMKMPRLYNYSHQNAPTRQRLFQHKTVTLYVGDIEVYIPILLCLYDFLE